MLERMELLLSKDNIDKVINSKVLIVGIVLLVFVFTIFIYSINQILGSNFFIKYKYILDFEQKKFYKR